MTAKRLVPALFPELCQTERSASRHPLVEAERLGDVPPAHAMRAVAVHAESVLAELPALARACDLRVSGAGLRIGRLFSVGRNAFADLLLDTERSYRGTLLGMRHGMDLVRLLGAAATVEGCAPLAAFCARWLEEREPLVARATDALAWLAAHPEIARRRARHARVPRDAASAAA